MACAKCGAAVEMTVNEGGVKEGRFMEAYRCTNGHAGYVRGEADAPVEQWTQNGEVFDG